MYSTVLHPDPNLGQYSKITTHDGKTIIGVELPNVKADWLSNVENYLRQNLVNGVDDPDLNYIVYWAKKVVGINITTKEAVYPDLNIDVYGQINGQSARLIGKIQDVIIPSTTVDDLCQYFNNNNGQLGISNGLNVVNEICQALSLGPNDICVGYVIKPKRFDISTTNRGSTNQIGKYQTKQP